MTRADEIAALSDEPTPRQKLAWKLERIILMRLHKKQVEGYTLEMSLELADEAMKESAE